MNKDINAIGIVRQMVADGQISQEVAEKYFPELKESREDEMIRIIKEVILKSVPYKINILTKDTTITAEEAIAWLEKQGKQKHKIQPKFKIGDIIRFKGNETLKGEAETHKIVRYDNELYVFDDGTTDLFCEQDLYELVEQKSILDVEIPFGAKDSELEEVSYSIPNGYHAEIEDNKVVIKKGEQKPAEWSEEIEAAISLLKDIAEEQEKDYCPHNANDLRKAALYLETCRSQSTLKPSDEHYELEEFARVVRGNLTGISKTVQKLFEAKYLQLTGRKMYIGFKD